MEFLQYLKSNSLFTKLSKSKQAQLTIIKVTQIDTDSDTPPPTASQETSCSLPYKILEQPLGTTRHVKIITIGAGASGLNMIRTIRKHLTNYTHTVYEKNPDVGGTWYENRYPGVKCDIPSHNYQFSWRPNPEWSAMWADGAEIQAYLKTCCAEADLEKDVKLGHKVVGARWNEEKGIWTVEVKDLQRGSLVEDWCHFLLDGSGILNHWKWPEIPGLHDFKGDLVHSANWSQDYSYKDKTVAVIGNGSSGVQIVPAIRRDVKQLVHFVRSPTWIAPPQLDRISASTAKDVMSQIELDGDRFTKAQIDRFVQNPRLYDEFVKRTEEVVNSKFSILINDSPEAEQVKVGGATYMKAMLKGDERLAKAMVPNFPVGCRRITPGVGYLEALTEDNVQVVTDAIVKIVPDGLITGSGDHIKVDSIICATGFDVGFVPRFPIIGRRSNLQDLWTKELPKSYMSCTIPDFPNYFMFLGPNAPIGHGSVLTITEHIAKYITTLIQKCQVQNIKAISPTHSAVSDFHEHIMTFMPRTAWSGSCRSWFKGGKENGPVTALHPGSRIHWFHMLEMVRGEDFEYVYWEGRNRFAYLGNGFSTREAKGQDQTWYLDRPDELF